MRDHNQRNKSKKAIVTLSWTEEAEDHNTSVLKIDNSFYIYFELFQDV